MIKINAKSLCSTHWVALSCLVIIISSLLQWDSSYVLCSWCDVWLHAAFFFLRNSPACFSNSNADGWSCVVCEFRGLTNSNVVSILFKVFTARFFCDQTRWCPLTLPIIGHFF